MKRSVLFVLILLLCCTGCSGEAEVSPSPTPAPTPTPEPVFVSGTIDGSTYTNEFLGLSFALPEDWSFASSQEFSEFIESGSVHLENNMELPESFGNSTFYEFYAQCGDIKHAIMTVEDLSAHEGGKLLTVNDFVETLSSQYNDITSVNYSVGESYEQHVAGRNCIMLPLSVEEAGIYQHICVFRSGNYMVTITFSATAEDELLLLEDQLSKY